MIVDSLKEQFHWCQQIWNQFVNSVGCDKNLRLVPLTVETLPKE